MEHYLVSARKYRPSTFSSVVGQKALTTTLKNAIATDRLAHSYLFCGSRGVGKTSCARIFAKTINCEHPTADGEACNECVSCQDFNRGTSMNIVELDAASNNGIDGMRTLIEQVQVPPSIGRYRVFIVDEVHMLSTAAFNAFLKTLEEPPSYVVFILATTEKHKIIPTILSRCQIYDFHRITIQDMIDHLKYVASEEGITAEESALNVIAQKADGAMRDALSIFDQVAASSGGNITYQSAIDNLNVLDYDYYNRLLDCFLKQDVMGSWLIYKEIRDRGFDSQFFINGLAGYLRDLMVARDPSTIGLIEAGDQIKAEIQKRATQCQPDFLYRAMSLCNDADLNYRTASNKQFLTELTLAKICQPAGPSRSNDGNGKGLLKRIAVDPKYLNIPQSNPFLQAAQPQSQPSQTPAGAPVNAPAANPAPQPAAAGSTQPKPVATGPRTFAGTSATAHHTPNAASTPTIGVPRISIRHGIQQQETQQRHGVQQLNRCQPFSEEALNSAWETYISTHPKAHILINTMRASRPRLVDKTHFVVTVQNQKQLELMEANSYDILQSIHNALSNDQVTFETTINTGSSPRHTLSDAELLQNMRREFPALESLIEDFKLRLS